MTLTFGRPVYGEYFAGNVKALRVSQSVPALLLTPDQTYLVFQAA